MKKIILVLAAMFMLASAYCTDIKVRNIGNVTIERENWRQNDKGEWCSGDRTDFYCIEFHKTDFNDRYYLAIHFYRNKNTAQEIYQITLPKEEAEAVLNDIINNKVPNVVFNKYQKLKKMSIASASAEDTATGKREGVSTASSRASEAKEDFVWEE